jgi:hypothetical protein
MGSILQYMQEEGVLSLNAKHTILLGPIKTQLRFHAIKVPLFTQYQN